MDVGDDGVHGCFLNPVPQRYFIQVGTRRRQRLAELQLLLTPAMYQRDVLNIEIGDDLKIGFLRSFARYVERLHAEDIVVGDFSPKNVAFSIAGGGDLFFLDVDGYSIGGQTTFGEAETFSWRVRDVTGHYEPWSPHSDVVKFGLLALRLLLGDQSSVSVSDKIDKYPRIRELVERSFSTNVTERPSMAEWSAGLAGSSSTAASASQAKGRVRVRRPAGLDILLVGTEWLPRHGGLSQVNRSLGVALSELGHRVTSTALARTADDVTDAARMNVRLVVPEVVPGYPSLHIRPDVADVDVVVGHDRFTGFEAVTQARQHFPAATLVMIAHTYPEDIEWLKERPGAAARAEERQGQLEALLTAADVRIGIGPRLTTAVSALLHDGFKHSTVLRIDPGLVEVARPAGRVPGPRLNVIVLGRSEDPELKGLDIACAAFGRISRNFGRASQLIIRGAADDRADELHARLCRDHGIARSDLVVRPFNPASDITTQDLRRSDVLMMPSRAEGFGLVGLESIAVGTPVLLSDRSGLADLLRELAPVESTSMIVPVTDCLRVDYGVWSAALAELARDLSTAYAKTLRLRDCLAETLDWRESAKMLVVAVQQFKSSNAERSRGV